tara:strand:+ start:1136 stop:1528 length:393 start_codon:yes stop_codon:yes gene_type:complete
MRLINWKPNNSLLDLFNDIDFYHNPFQNNNESTLRNYDDHYKIILEMPGISKKNINISVEGDIINVNAKNSRNLSDDNNDVINYNYDKSYYMPDDVNVDKIKADYKDGLLELKLPKSKQLNKNIKKISLS